MVKRYNESSKPRPAAARTIPDLATNVIDVNSEFQTQFKPFTKKGDPTTYTAKALAYYNDEKANIVVNEGFQPIEPGVQLSRYAPGQGYYRPGQPNG
jgi:hypothetical protein